MANKTVVKPLTVRLHPRLYRRAKEVALAREISLNALIQHGLKEAVEQEEYQVRFDAYTLLGQDPEYCDIEYAFEAQAEVALSD